MLETMRNGSQNVFVKIFLILLALSFVVWGIGDVFRGKTSNIVAKVDNREISTIEFSNSLQREVARYQEMFGTALTEEQMNQLNFKQIVLNRLINSNLVSIRSNQLGLQVGEESVRDIIRRNPVFFDENGNFTQESFSSTLRSNGINQRQYINSIKNGLAVDLLVQTLILPPENLEMQAKAMFSYLHEQRIADIFYIPSKLEDEILEPSETDLVQFYQENTAKYTSPETRNVNYISFDLDKIKSGIKVSDEELKSIYESRIDQFKIAAKRDLDQYLFEEESKAKSFYDKLINTQQVDDNLIIKMGKIARQDLIEGLDKAVFDAELGIVAPVKSSLGWHVFVVNKIIDARTSSFEEVKPQLQKEAIQAQAASEYENFAIQVEDSFANGKSLEEVAKLYDLKLKEIEELQLDGVTKNKSQQITLLDKGVFLEQVFSSEAKVTAPMTFTNDGAYFVTRVEKITPSRVKALDEVKGKVIEDSKEDIRRKRLLERTNKIVGELKKVNSPEEFDRIKKQYDLTLKESKTIKRPNVNSQVEEKENLNLPFSITSELFDIDVNNYTTTYMNSSGQFVVAKLKEVKIPNVESNISDYNSITNQLKQNHADSLLFQYNEYLRSKFDIKINQAILNGS